MSKSNDPDKNIFDEAFARKIISIISLGAFFGLGLWMLRDPEGVEHSNVEKGSVYIMKEIWSLEAGIIILATTIPFIVFSVLKVMNMAKHTWYKDASGYYLYINKQRSSGNSSVYQGKDLMVFHPDSGNVYRLKNYQGSKVGKFYSALPSKGLSTAKAYWSANPDGYSIVYNGKNLLNTTSKYEGDDLFVMADDIRKRFKLPNYRNNLDGVLREAEVLN